MTPITCDRPAAGATDQNPSCGSEARAGPTRFRGPARTRVDQSVEQPGHVRPSGAVTGQDPSRTGGRATGRGALSAREFPKLGAGLVRDACSHAALRRYRGSTQACRSVPTRRSSLSRETTSSLGPRGGRPRARRCTPCARSAGRASAAGRARPARRARAPGAPTRATGRSSRCAAGRCVTCRWSRGWSPPAWRSRRMRSSPAPGISAGEPRTRKSRAVCPATTSRRTRPSGRLTPSRSRRRPRTCGRGWRRSATAGAASTATTGSRTCSCGPLGGTPGYRSAETILPTRQQLSAGDFIPAAPPDMLGGRLAQKTGWKVLAVEPNRVLVLEGWGAFVLEPLGDRATRLLVRSRGAGAWGRLAHYLFWEPAHFVMERRMLLGIKERAERLAQRQGAAGRRVPGSSARLTGSSGDARVRAADRAPARDRDRDRRIL